jgi:hypothetical protein
MLACYIPLYECPAFVLLYYSLMSSRNNGDEAGDQPNNGDDMGAQPNNGDEAGAQPNNGDEVGAQGSHSQ